MSYDSAPETYKHILEVQRQLNHVVANLIDRGHVHDQSKLLPPEKEAFDEITPRLKGVTYGSEEYRATLREMKPAIQHHQFNNSHHPEFYGYQECNGCFKRFPKEFEGPCGMCGYTQFQLRSDVSKMSLLDLIEMLCDWKAATLRHDDGDLYKSIAINQERFGYTDEMKSILIATAAELGMFS